jgi:hypothetical protein
MSELENLLKRLADSNEANHALVEQMLKTNQSLVRRLTLENTATIYGCCGLFDLCSDQDLMSLSLEHSNKFMDWLGWILTDVCVERRSFITYVRPEQYAGACTEGYLADPCATPNTYEFGTCDFMVEDFGRIRRRGHVLDATYDFVKYCERSPMYRLDGTRIENQTEYEIRFATETLLQDLKRYVITGTRATGGLFDGLESVAINGYKDPAGKLCTSMDSIVLDWNQNDMNGGAGITWNGAPVGAGFNFIDVLMAAFRHIKRNIQWAPSLAAQQLQAGNMIILLPDFMAQCLLDFFTCWSVCPGAQYNEVAIQNYEARQFRLSLNGGLYGDGQISIDGFTIPLIRYDWELIKGPNRGDIYLLTGAVGNVKTLVGEMLDMRPVPTKHQKFSYTDGGRLLTWEETDETCTAQRVEMRPRIVAWAPWTLARFHDVRCTVPGGPKSPDPCEESWFPEECFCVAACPE